MRSRLRHRRAVSSSGQVVSRFRLAACSSTAPACLALLPLGWPSHTGPDSQLCDPWRPPRKPKHETRNRGSPKTTTRKEPRKTENRGTGSQPTELEPKWQSTRASVVHFLAAALGLNPEVTIVSRQDRCFRYYESPVHVAGPAWRAGGKRVSPVCPDVLLRALGV